jgi:hypothetical protein
MSNDTATFSSRKIWICAGIGVVGAALAFWCISPIWSRQPQLTAKLLLILLGFIVATGGMLFVSTQTISTVKSEHPRDMESRIDTIIVGTILVVVVLCGAFVEAVGLTCYSGGGFTAACLGLMLSLAALIVGVLIGFLFGVPRAVAAPESDPGSGGQAGTRHGADQLANQPTSPPSSPPGTDNAAAGGPVPVPPNPLGFQANTNLTQISDWLTKTIVGVGLVESREGLKWFENTAVNLGNGLMIGSTSGPVVAGSIMVFFSVSGFLCGYNLTQLFLARRLAGLED